MDNLHVCPYVAVEIFLQNGKELPNVPGVGLRVQHPN